MTKRQPRFGRPPGVSSGLWVTSPSPGIALVYKAAMLVDPDGEVAVDTIGDALEMFFTDD